MHPNLLAIAAILKCHKGAQAILHQRRLDAGKLAGPRAPSVSDHDIM